MWPERQQLAQGGFVVIGIGAAPIQILHLLPGRDGLCHISELADGYVASVGDVCKVGDHMKVKVIAVDEQDRVKLSRKVAMRELAESETETVEA